LAHLGLYYSFASASACTDFSFHYTKYVYESSESYESEISSKEEFSCACSSSLIGGRKKSVSLWLLMYMRDNFLELDTMLNDELVCVNIHESISLCTIEVSNKNTLCTMWIKCLSLLRGNLGPCARTKYMKVGHFLFEVAPSLEGGLILDRYMGIYFLDVGFTIKFSIP
jgi:hypothetical protein